MSKPPKRPNQRDDLKRWDSEGGAPRSGHPTPKARAGSRRKPAAFSLAITSPSGTTEDTTGDRYSSLEAAQDGAFAKARAMIAEGDRNGEDRRGWHIEIMDGANQQVLTVAFADISGSEISRHNAASDLPQTSKSEDMQANQEREKIQRHPEQLKISGADHRSSEGTPRIGLDGVVQQADGLEGTRLHAPSHQAGNLSGRVKVWMQERSVRGTSESSLAEEATNPVYILAAITLGIPALLLILLVGMNPGVQEGTLTTLATFLVISAFVTAAVFEIKRLADQASDEDHPLNHH